jgi:hypothetical protein
MGAGRHSGAQRPAQAAHTAAASGPRTRLRLWPVLTLALVLAVAAGVVRATVESRAGDFDAAPPPRDGSFATLPVGAWRTLPDGAACARQVPRSSWEPRPGNHGPNHTRPDPAAVRAAFAARPRGSDGSYDPRWNSWLLPRVTGASVGTTDELIQWAACKWGVADNLLRAVAALESRWFQAAEDPATGRCVLGRGCADPFTTRTEAGAAFCAEISRYGHDYTEDYPAGRCPRTFSIVGVMAWQDPEWGAMPGNQNGTFPFSRDSTAFALDYFAAFLRGCHEGWLTWLGETGEGSYRPGDLWGCVGTWYAGAWKVPVAEEYAARVREVLDRRVWLDPRWPQ